MSSATWSRHSIERTLWITSMSCSTTGSGVPATTKSVSRSPHWEPKLDRRHDGERICQRLTTGSELRYAGTANTMKPPGENAMLKRCALWIGGGDRRCPVVVPRFRLSSHDLLLSRTQRDGVPFRISNCTASGTGAGVCAHAPNAQTRIAAVHPKLPTSLSRTLPWEAHRFVGSNRVRTCSDEDFA